MAAARAERPQENSGARLLGRRRHKRNFAYLFSVDRVAFEILFCDRQDSVAEGSDLRRAAAVAAIDKVVIPVGRAGDEIERPNGPARGDIVEEEMGRAQRGAAL
jgi:hypothetical protein